MKLFFRFLHWAPVIARLILGMALLVGQYQSDGSVVHPAALLVLIWAVISLGGPLAVGLPNKEILLSLFAVDVAAATFATWYVPEVLPHTLALLACSCQLLFRSGFRTYYLALLGLPVATAIVSATAFGGVTDKSSNAVLSLTNQFLFALAALNAGVAIAISVLRGDQIRHFREQITSIPMLKLERSLEFDLQRFVDALGSIFAPGRAVCLISETTEHAAPRRFETGGHVDIEEHEIKKLYALGSELGVPDLMMRNSPPMAIALSSYQPSPLTDVGKSVSALLARKDFDTCLIKWVQIGRARGIVICAVSAIDVIKLYEARTICQALDELFPLLDSISEAERQFIADAHDVARRDLHDGVLQSLAAVRMRLLTTAKRQDLKDHGARPEIQKIADILTLEQARLRGLLETSESEDHGINLVTTLDVALRAISMQWEIDARLESEEPAMPTDKESAINIEHLVREAVANAVRHANSTQLTVRLSLHQNALKMVIIDRSDGAAGARKRKGKDSMPLKSASLLQRLRLVNGSAYADGMDRSAILAITIPMQRIDNA